jgi:hypothetical protein
VARFTPSDPIKVYFQAGINIASIVRTNSTNLITFGSVLNSTFYLEANDDLGTKEWLPLGSVPGNDLLQSLSDTAAPAHGERFYRIRVTTS